MAERKTRVLHNGALVDAMDVPIKDSSEKWSEFILEDGTILRMKLTLVSAARIDGQYNDQGEPVYGMNLAPVIVTIEIPDKLKRKNT